MKRPKLSTKFKGILSTAALIGSVAFFGVLLLNKQNLEKYASTVAKQGNTAENNQSAEFTVNKLYNYTNNKQAYQYTFLEFGAKGCSACLRMETVMDEIRKNHGDKIKVVFYNVLLPENQALMQYFGVATIPTQVFLDKSGKEIYRHNGYISAKEIEKLLNESR